MNKTNLEYKDRVFKAIDMMHTIPISSLPDELFSDYDFVIKLLSTEYIMNSYDIVIASKLTTFLDNKESITNFINIYPRIAAHITKELEIISSPLLEDKDFCIFLISSMANSIVHMPPKIYNDTEILSLVFNSNNFTYSASLMKLNPVPLSTTQNFKQLLKKIDNDNYHLAYSCCNETVRNDKKLFLETYQSSAYFNLLGEQLKQDTNFWKIILEEIYYDLKLPENNNSVDIFLAQRSFEKNCNSPEIIKDYNEHIDSIQDLTTENTAKFLSYVTKVHIRNNKNILLDDIAHINVKKQHTKKSL